MQVTQVHLTFSPDALKGLVNDYAHVKAQIATLQEQEALLRASLIATGLFAIDSDAHRVTISETTRTFTDWRAVAEHLKPSRQLVTAHTRTTEPSYTVRVYGRKTTD